MFGNKGNLHLKSAAGRGSYFIAVNKKYRGYHLFKCHLSLLSAKTLKGKAIQMYRFFITNKIFRKFFL